MKRFGKFGSWCIALVALGLLMMKFIVGFDHIWDRAGGTTQVVPLDFATLEKTKQPNQFLICPPDFCAEDPDQQAPVFNLSVSELKSKFQTIAMAKNSVSYVEFEGDSLAEGYISRAGFFRFPNLINVEYIKLGPGQSTLAIYARAKLGEYDFGVNRKLVQQWLAQLN